MLATALVLAALAALVHVAIFVMEAIAFGRPDVRARFLVADDEVAAVRPWALNQGFYNLFLAVVAVVGVVLAATGSHTVGLALVLAACGSMAGAAVVLVATDRRMARAAATQGVVPTLAVVAAIVALA